MRIHIHIFLLPLMIYGNSLSVISELDTTNGYIGDIIKWKVKVEGVNTQKFKFPILDEIDEIMTIKGHQLLYENLDEKPNGIEFELVIWDTGKFQTPDYAINILNLDGTIDYDLHVEPIELEIFSILDSEMKNEFIDIKGPVPVKEVFPLKEVLLCISLLLSFIGIVWIWGLRKEPNYEKIDYSILESPTERASRRLSELDNSLLTKEYYSTLSHIIREYIETKYFIRTLEMNTQEIEASIDILKINKSYFSELITFLHKSDKVKYAQNIPKPEKMIEDKKKIKAMIDNI